MLAVISSGCGQSLKVDMDKAVALDTNAPPVNLAAEISLANTQHKLLLMEFGSSDSCPPCVAFQKYVFSTPQFAAYEKSNLVFVRLDYPLRSALRPDTQATNDLLATQFNVSGYPTFIALNRDGKESWREEGLTSEELGSPATFTAMLEVIKEKQK
jgi:thioredoxin-related protein